MSSLEQFKAQHSFTLVASQFGYHFSPNKTNICPACNKATFSIFNNDTRYKCFRPNCELNKTGDIFNFLQFIGISNSFKESLELLNINQSSKTNSILNEVYRIYLDEFKETTKGKQYLLNRGYNLAKIDVGYAPSYSILSHKLNNHIDNLKKYYLINDKDEDYFRDRLIFPIRNYSNKIVHFHSRDLSNNPNAIRWMGTKKREDRNIDYLWRGNIEYKSKAIFLTEGISDGLSLLSWDLPVVSTLSIQGDFIELLKPFNDLEELHCIFDNDKQTVNNSSLSGTYKSWEFIIPKLVSLKLLRPSLNIYCMMPPNKNNIKDLNDWFNVSTKEEFYTYYTENTLSIEEFIFKYFHPRIDYYKHLIKLSQHSLPLRHKLKSYIDSNFNDYIDFINLIL